MIRLIVMEFGRFIRIRPSRAERGRFSSMIALRLEKGGELIRR